MAAFRSAFCSSHENVERSNTLRRVIHAPLLCCLRRQRLYHGNILQQILWNAMPAA
jgi:hypothetical protein